MLIKKNAETIFVKLKKKRKKNENHQGTKMFSEFKAFTRYLYHFQRKINKEKESSNLFMKLLSTSTILFVNKVIEFRLKH